MNTFIPYENVRHYITSTLPTGSYEIHTPDEPTFGSIMDRDLAKAFENASTIYSVAGEMSNFLRAEVVAAVMAFLSMNGRLTQIAGPVIMGDIMDGKPSHPMLRLREKYSDAYLFRTNMQSEISGDQFNHFRLAQLRDQSRSIYVEPYHTRCERVSECVIVHRPDDRLWAMMLGNFNAINDLCAPYSMNELDILPLDRWERAKELELSDSFDETDDEFIRLSMREYDDAPNSIKRLLESKIAGIEAALDSI